MDATATALPMLLYEQLSRTPDRESVTYVAADDGCDRLDAGSLLRRACEFAHALGRVKRSEARIAGICLYHGVDLHAAFVGALFAGHIPTMIAPPSPRMDPDRYASGFRGLLAHVRPECVVLDGPTKQALEQRGLGANDTTRLVDASTVAGGEPEAPAPCAMDDVVLLQHSSGTTGLQKGIALDSRMVLAHDRAYRSCLGIDERDVIGSWLPLYHDMGFIACFVMPLVAGIRFVEISPFDWVRRPLMLLDHLDREDATLCWLPNFAFSFMAEQYRPERVREGLDLGRVRAFVNSSEPVLAPSMRAFADTFAPHGVREDQLSASYAMAENVYAVTQSQPGKLRTLRLDGRELQRGRVVPSDAGDARELVSCGPVVEGTELRVIGDDDAWLPEEAVGELCLRGEYLFGGYWGRDDLTAQATTADGWYRTGDVGFVHDGEVYVTGRKKDLIIIQGRNFVPSDFEEATGDVPGAIKGRCVAFGVPLAESGTEGLVILTEADGSEHEKRLALQIRKRIAQDFDCTPHDVRVVPQRWLVKSTSGKLARAANREKYLESRS